MKRTVWTNHRWEEVLPKIGQVCFECLRCGISKYGIPYGGWEYLDIRESRISNNRLTFDKPLCKPTQTELTLTK